MIKKTFKRQLGIFITSFLLTACIILFSVSGIVIEKNTGKMLGKSISRTFALDFKDDNATLTINDREYVFSLKTVNQAAKSKGGALLMTILLVL